MPEMKDFLQEQKLKLLQASVNSQGETDAGSWSPFRASSPLTPDARRTALRLHMHFLNSYSIGSQNCVSTEDLLSDLQLLLENPSEIFEFSQAEEIPWAFIFFFNLCGKYNYGQLEFLNREFYADCFDPILSFLKSTEFVDLDKMDELETASFISKCEQIIKFLFHSHLLDFQVRKFTQHSQNQNVCEKWDHAKIYEEILKLTFACGLFFRDFLGRRRLSQ